MSKDRITKSFSLTKGAASALALLQSHHINLSKYVDDLIIKAVMRELEAVEDVKEEEI